MARSTAALATLWLFACGPAPGAGGDDDGSGGLDAAAGENDGSIISDAAPLSDASCGAQTEDIELVDLGDPPDMLIVLDRSGSMSNPVDPFNPPPFGPSRWDAMTGALETITQSYDDKIRFGLAVFPTDANCGVSAGAEVPITDMTSSEIVSYMNGATPDGNTPAPAGLENARDIYTGIPENPEGQYVLFSTDGEPNCGGPNQDQESDAETVQAVTDLANMDIPSFVLGFGDSLALDTSTLNDAALAGTLPRPGGPPHFYQAEDQAELEQALDDIAGGIVVPSCEYELAEQPPDPDLVTVTIDGTPVPRDPSHQNGWDYHPDMSTITFFGSYCDMLQSGNAGEVSFTFGCPGPEVE